MTMLHGIRQLAKLGSVQGVAKEERNFIAITQSCQNQQYVLNAEQLAKISRYRLLHKTIG
jgi:hypothetical protein